MTDTTPIPPFMTRTFTVQAQIPQVECINLLAQAMLTYADMTDTERAAVAAWFGKTYGTGRAPSSP